MTSAEVSKSVNGALKRAETGNGAGSPADEHLVILHEILGGIDELRQRAPHQKRGLVFSEYQLLQKLLPALGGKFGDSVFTVRDLLDHPVFRAMLHGKSARQVGNLFSRAADWTIDRYRLRSSGSFDHNLILWTNVEV